MFKLKKIVYRMLCNNTSGAIIKGIFNDKVPDIRWRKYRFDTTGSGMRNSIVASIFWGFYEGAEIRFIEKYFKGNTDVIELGASSGIISAHLLSKMQQNKKLVSVEANDSLAAVWKINSDRHNINKTHAFLLNKAVHYESDSVLFAVSDNTTESRLLHTDEPATNARNIPAVTLHALIDQYKLDAYSLFCDIEGAEIEMLLNDKSALAKCRNIFIELHETVYQNKSYSTGMMKNIIIELGFELKDAYGNVYFFSRKF